jgi:hypothetical protein
MMMMIYIYIRRFVTSDDGQFPIYNSNPIKITVVKTH